MLGTLRTFDVAQREDIVRRLTRTIENTAAANGATATLDLVENNYPVTYNDPALTARALPSLKRVVGDDNVKEIPLSTIAEDFSFYGDKAPAFFFFVGITPPDKDPSAAPSNHSDNFYVDEKGMLIGLSAMTQLALDMLTTHDAGNRVD
jgi:amidohydrolase